MSDQSSVITADDAKVLQNATAAVLIGAIASGHSGAVGAFHELYSGAKGLKSRIENIKSPELARALTNENVDSSNVPDSLPKSDEERGKAMDAGVNQAVAAVALIKSKIGEEDATTFGIALQEMAQKAVEATKTGSFLGIGGTKVTDEESAYVNRLADALS